MGLVLNNHCKCWSYEMICEIYGTCLCRTFKPEFPNTDLRGSEVMNIGTNPCKGNCQGKNMRPAVRHREAGKTSVVFSN
jgi:hypothetical protein